MSTLTKTIFSITLGLILFGCLSAQLYAQRLKLSRERIASLDAITARQRALWVEMNSQTKYSFNSYLDSIKGANPVQYRAHIHFQDSMKLIWEIEGIRVKEYNMLKYDSLLKGPEIWNQTSINLSNGLFKDIPGEVLKIRDLGILDISDNKITDLSRETMGILAVKNLDLQGNQLGAGQLSLEKNSTIQILNLAGNQMDKIPAKLKRLKNLQSLNLSNNQLGKNGKRIRFKKGESLEELNLSSNELGSIPKSLRKLKNLKKLNLNNCHLTSLKGLEKLKSLEEVELDFNIVALDPRYFYSLNRLEKISMRKCGLIDLPPEISYLYNLKKLVLPENELTKLPGEIGEL